jgi:hypothetical protein
VQVLPEVIPLAEPIVITITLFGEERLPVASIDPRRIRLRALGILGVLPPALPPWIADRDQDSHLDLTVPFILRPEPNCCEDLPPGLFHSFFDLTVDIDQPILAGTSGSRGRVWR